jgi:hypothetical protein
MKLPTITTCVIALFFLSSTTINAKVYTWKDENGITHYAATPPRPSEKISQLTDDLRLINNKATTQHTKQEESIASTKNDAKKKPHVSKEKNRDYCEEKQKNLILLKKHTQVKWIENGKNTKLSKEQRKDKIHSLEENIRTDCSYNDKAIND